MYIIRIHSYRRYPRVASVRGFGSCVWNPKLQGWNPKSLGWNPKSRRWNPKCRRWNPKSAPWNPKFRRRNPKFVRFPTAGIRNSRVSHRWNPKSRAWTDDDIVMEMVISAVFEIMLVSGFMGVSIVCFRFSQSPTLRVPSSMSSQPKGVETPAYGCPLRGALSL